MKSYLILILLLSIICGCKDESNQSDISKNQKMVSPEANQMNPLILKGMYSYSPLKGKFFDCLSDKTYLLAEKGESAAIERAYVNIPDKRPEEKVYVELEGFISTQAKSEGLDFDSVLVVTRFFLFDRSKKCD